MSLLESIDQKAFLGTEFLTWLWFRAENGEGAFALPDLGDFEVTLDTVALLASEEPADVGTALLKGESPGASELIRRAVAEGKKIQRASFRVVWENIAWSATVNGETLDVSGVKLPVAAPAGGADRIEHFRLRLQTLESFLDLWDHLFHYFAAIRLDENSWTAERGRLVEWLVGELND
jgi:hypothetical protein